MAQMICGTCSTVAAPRSVKERPGSGPVVGLVVTGVIGLVFWPMLLVAFLFFLATIARALTHAVGGKITHHCPACNAATMIPLDTPRARQLMAAAQAASAGPAEVAAPPPAPLLY